MKKLFFKMIETKRFKNMKQVEPMVRSVRDEHLWNLLESSKGVKIDMVEALFNEQRAIKSAEDKVRNFLKWLQSRAQPSTFTKATFALLQNVVDTCLKLLRRRGK